MENEELLIACRDGTIIVVHHHHDWRYSVARARYCEWGADHYDAGDSFLSCRTAAVSYADEACGGVAWEYRIS